MTTSVAASCVTEHRYRLVNGVCMRLHSVACVAAAVRKSTGTIRRWERAGLIPPSPYVRVVQGSECRRLYPDELLERIRWAAERTGIAGRKPFDMAASGFPELLRRVWDEPVPKLPD